MGQEPMTETPSGSTGSFDDAVLADISARAADLESKARLDAGGYGRWRYRYERLYYLLGVPATALAAVAGATAFADNPSNAVVGSCAVGAAALTGIQTVVRPDRRAKFNQSQQFVMARLAEDASILAMCRSRALSVEQAQGQLSALYDRYYDARGRSPD